MSVSCTRCGTSLNAQGDAHDCDGRVIRIEYENHLHELGNTANVSIDSVATSADVPRAAVKNWIKATPGLELVDGWIRIIQVIAEPEPSPTNTEGITGMFLMIRIEELSRELGRKDVEVALLQAELRKLRGES